MKQYAYRYTALGALLLLSAAFIVILVKKQNKTKNQTATAQQEQVLTQGKARFSSGKSSHSPKALLNRQTRLLNRSRQALFDNEEDLALKDWKTLQSADTTDREAMATFIDAYARNPKHAEGLHQQNAWVLRREMIQQQQTFTDLGKKIMQGEKIERLVLPGIEGEAIPVTVKDISKVVAEHQGTIIGVVEGESHSTAVITYYKGMMSGYISTVRGGGRTLTYEPYSSDQLIVNEVDSIAKGLAHPCECESCVETQQEAQEQFHQDMSSEASGLDQTSTTTDRS